MTSRIHHSWDPIKTKLYLEPLTTLNQTILPNILSYPKKEDIFRVFDMPIDLVKIVILGKDPYPTKDDAIGLSFVNGTEKVPASLRIIKKEIEDEGYPPADIHSWEDQGVFLLNTALTVESGNAGSHLDYWRGFTEDVIKYLSFSNPTIWLLWGKKAQEYKKFIHRPYMVTDAVMKDINDLPLSAQYNFVLESPHPAAEAYAGGNAGFYGNNYFKNVNEILKKKQKQEIVW